MSSTRRLLELLLITMVVATAMFAAPSDARAFCGFYVSDASGDLYNDASQVVMMRHGTQTILSMRNNYQGPPKDFALVVPVPQILKKEDVKTLDDSVFDHITKFTAPRLVEYWERKSCSEREYSSGIGLDRLTSSKGGGTTTAAVSRFEVGEYDVVILSSKESNSLEKWLLDNGYNIPEGASKALAPYIAQGMYFFVAKVDAKKVKFDSKGNALLSPLRFHYRSEEFSLPVRLGLLNAKGPQDLIVHILSLDGRYQVANYPNVAIPTNILVPAKIKKNFSAFYEALFSYTLEQWPGAVVTEYSWAVGPGKCDPCTTTPVSVDQLMAFGADITNGVREDVYLHGLDAEITSNNPDYGDKQTINLVRRHTWHLARRHWKRCVVPSSDAITSKGHFTVEFQFSYGRRNNAKLLDHDVAGEAFAKCIARTIPFLSSHRSIPESHLFTVKAQIKVDKLFFPITPIPQHLHLTRLHTRYDSKSLAEDLIFEQAVRLRGGIGSPSLKTGKLPTTKYRTRKDGAFQARYIIIERTKEAPVCEEGKPLYHWWDTQRGASRKPSAKATPSAKKRGRHKLSKDMKAQVRQQLEAQK